MALVHQSCYATASKKKLPEATRAFPQLSSCPSSKFLFLHQDLESISKVTQNFCQHLIAFGLLHLVIVIVPYIPLCALRKTRPIMAITITTRSMTMQKVNVVRETIEKVTASSRRDLNSASAKVVLSTTDVGAVLDFIAAERLRCMPHSGSRYDKVLRWAEIFVLHVAAFAQRASDAVPSSYEATQQIWGSALLLLQASFRSLSLRMN